MNVMTSIASVVPARFAAIEAFRLPAEFLQHVKGSFEGGFAGGGKIVAKRAKTHNRLSFRVVPPE
jgi:hypothetical protein